MKSKNEICTISGTTTVDGKTVVVDLCALSTTSVGACVSDKLNDKQSKWDKDELNNQISLSSNNFAGVYLGVESIDGKCIVTLSPDNKNLRFDLVRDGASNEVFVKTTKESSKCFSASDPKYLTMGVPTNEGNIPISFEPAMEGREQSKQKWKFTKASSDGGA